LVDARVAQLRSRAGLLWGLVIVVLLLLRLPTLVQPAGGDQGLYAYAGQRLLAGDVPYLDAWDQKPPGVMFLYAAMLAVWPHESVVPGVDLLLAAAVAALLVWLGRRRFSVNVGCGAAVLYLTFGNPALQRMGGMYSRAQCEPFIAVAVAAALLLLASHRRARVHLLLAGGFLAVAFWLKYNAIAYGLPAAVATLLWRPAAGSRSRWSSVRDIAWVGAGFVSVAILVLGWFWANGALVELRRATIDYNLQYSDGTYSSPLDILTYLVVFPFERARTDMIWYLGGVGMLCLLWRARAESGTRVVLAWIAGAAVSVVINGQRDLPNYFVQAFPALAMAASAGLARGMAASWVSRAMVIAVVALGLWRVGAEVPTGGLRLGGLPGLVDNFHFDLGRATGAIDQETYLARFSGIKHDPLENFRLTNYLIETTTDTESVFVFGFSGGSVGWLSGRRSPTRFFWSHPVTIEFAAGTPGYGSAGMLTELQADPPTVVVLQREQWRSLEFFLGQPALRVWLEQGYQPAHESPMFSVWRRRPSAVP